MTVRLPACNNNGLSLVEQTQLFLLFETASGYALFERLESEEIGQVKKEIKEREGKKKIILSPFS